MTVRLFTIRMRLNAPDSVFHDHAGTVDAHELHSARKRDKSLTLHLDDGRTTIAFPDELEPVGDMVRTRA